MYETDNPSPIYDEITAAEEVDGEATTKNCNLLQSVLLENFRCYPVADSLPHQATKDVTLDGFHVPKVRYFLLKK